MNPERFSETLASQFEAGSTGSVEVTVESVHNSRTHGWTPRVNARLDAIGVR